MKKYPKIPYWNKGFFDEFCYAFDKLDGSNIRVEWQRKLAKKSTIGGFAKFGTRQTMIGKNHPFGEVVDIFYKELAGPLEKIFFNHPHFRNQPKITLFLEYFGVNSFAGLHQESDEKQLILIDVDQYQKGFVPPKDFIEIFKGIGIPKVIYQGFYTTDFIQEVRSNKYNLTEGVVCKGVRKTKGRDIVWMTKIKTDEWLERVKKKMGLLKFQEELNGDPELISQFI
jgi:hypothetical protein